MKLIVFTDEPALPEVRLVVGEAKKRGLETRVLAPWDINLPPTPELEADVYYIGSNILNRVSAFELLHRLQILRVFEELGQVINPVESILNYSKEHLTLRLRALGLPHPETLITENVEEAYAFAAQLLDSGRNVVLKPLCRGRGIGVVMLDRIRSRRDLLQFLTWYNRVHGQGVFYLQEYIPNRGYDIRCFVIDGEVVDREKRSNPEDFRYNIRLGGVAEAFPDPIYDELAVEVAE
ncbi:MAG: ribosomal protein S6 modification protein, partial [Candidatus Bathyarchaeota archaeon B23]